MSELNEPLVINGITVDPYCEACPLVVSCIDRVESLNEVRETQVHANNVYVERMGEDDEMFESDHEELLSELRESIGELNTAEDMRARSRLIEELAQNFAARQGKWSEERIGRLAEHMTTLALTDDEIELYRDLAHNLQADCRNHRELNSTRRGRFLLGLKGMFAYPTSPIPGCDAPNAREIKRVADLQLSELSDIRTERMKQGWI
ncbi:MAG: hypothetical protein ACREGG_03950 [Candidatus Saccharimonadales bacterium]